jgi:hypothetical protein
MARKLFAEIGRAVDFALEKHPLPKTALRVDFEH